MSGSDSQQQPSDLQRLVTELAGIMGRACVKFFEDCGPLIKAFAEIAARPDVQAELRRREALHGIAVASGCHCLCGYVHPDDKGICDGEPATTVRRSTELTGSVDIPTCAPCAAALFAGELTATR
jgi:hypothetical protein